MAKHAPFITTTHGGSGYFAVMMWWNPDPGFTEPYQTGIGRYGNRASAVQEAKDWAESEGLEFQE